MRTITRSELKGILENVNNPDMISFISKVPVKMNQYLDYWLVGENGKKSKNPNPTVNPFLENGIFNLSKKFKIITGFDYENSVNNRLKKEGKEQNFVSGEGREVWFEMISKGLVTDKKTHQKFYLRYQFLKDSVTSTEYLYNGNPILKQLFESYMTQKNEDSYQNQGLDDTLNFQVCNLDNILEISMGGEKYQLTD
jgi:hypothetical protein